MKKCTVFIRKQSSIIFLLLCLLFLGAFCISCRNTTSAFSNQNKFFKIFQGTLENDHIVNFYFERNQISDEPDSTLFCVVNDSDKNEPQYLEGTISPQGHFEFLYDYEDSQKPLLSGQFISDSEIEIRYADTLSKKVFEMNLEELKDKFVITPMYYYQGKSAGYLEKTETGESYSYLGLNILSFELKDKKVTDKINAVIKKSVGLRTGQTYDEFIKEKKALAQESIRFGLCYSENDIVTLQKSYFSRCSDCPQTDVEITYINFDIKSNKEIVLDDIFSKKEIKVLEFLCENKFREKYELDDSSVKNFYLPKDFGLYRNGITFILQPYNNGIDSFNNDVMDIFIPYSEVEVLMNKTDLTKRLIH